MAESNAALDSLGPDSPDSDRDDTPRKREHPKEQGPRPRLDPNSSELDTHDYKRRRSSNWPLPKEPLPEPDYDRERPSPSPSDIDHRGSEVIRGSKFQEGSMNDRPSQQPPSVFTRAFIGNGGSSSNDPSAMDRLMDDYHDDAALRTTPSAREMDVSPSKRFSHHSNPSTSSNTTSASKQSGIYRFGRSIASSFNPANIWRGVVNRWEAARDELIREDQEKYRQELEERKARAEATYAELKRAGKLHSQGTQNLASISTNRMAVAQTGGSQRDSGVDLDEVRASIENRQSAGPSSTLPRKASFKFRSPSFGNLKKVKSEMQLNAKDSIGHPDLRKVQSKKDLHKREKLVKRVSDLEAKLEEAKRELSRALNDAPPVPALPRSVPASNLGSSRPSSRGSSSPVKRRFVPGQLPTLPSERLLFPERIEERTDVEIEATTAREEVVTPIDPLGDYSSIHPHADTPAPPSRPAPPPPKAKVTRKRKSGDNNDLLDPDDLWNNEAELQQPTKDARNTKKRKSGNEEDLQQPNTSEAESKAAPQPAKSKVTKKRKSENEDELQFDLSTNDRAKTVPPSKSRLSKKRKSGGNEDDEFRHRPTSENDDAEWEEATKKNKSLKKSVPASLSKMNDTTGAASSPSRQSRGRKPLVQDASTDTTAALKVPINDVPYKPTACATPAHPRGSSYGVRSPSGHRLTKQRSFSQRRPSTPRSRDGRSPSRPSDPEEAIHLVPDGVSVPLMPELPDGSKQPKGPVVKEDYPWPDDVF